MLNESSSLRFRIPNVYGGLAEVCGILKARQEGLVLELEVKDALFKVLQLKSHEIHIPLDEIAAIGFKPGWFGGRITLRANTLRSLQHVPGSTAGEIKLKIARQDLAQAKAFVSHVSLALTTRDVQRMVDDIDEARLGKLNP